MIKWRAVYVDSDNIMHLEYIESESKEILQKSLENKGFTVKSITDPLD